MTGHFLLALIHRLGPAGVGLGAALEGETAVVVGGAAAHHGLFNPVAGALAAWLGSFLADQFVFWASRHERERAWVCKLRDKPAVHRALAIVDHHPRLFCFAFRFVYGFRVAGPAAVGASDVPGRTFVICNALSAGLWATLFTWAGYRFGPALERAVGSLFRMPAAVLEVGVFALLLIAVLVWRSRK